MEVLDSIVASVKEVLGAVSPETLGMPVLIGITVMMVIFAVLYFRARSKADDLEEEKDDLKRVLLDLSNSFESVEIIDSFNSVITSYERNGDDFRTEERPLLATTEIFGEVYPEDAEQYLTENSQTIMERVLKTCGREEYIFRVKDTTGHFQWMSCILQGLRRSGSHHRVCVLLKRNIENTVNKERERRKVLQSTLDEAQKAADNKARFLAKMAHEFEDPLKSLNDSLTMAATQGLENAEVLSYVGNASTVAKHLQGMMKDVLSMSSLEDGKLQLIPYSFNFKQSLVDISRVFYEDARSRNLNFETIAKDVDEEYVIGDKIRINQIIINLVSNAMKFTPEGGMVTLTVAQENVRNGKVFMHIEVADTGKGISLEQQKNIFLPFEHEGRDRDNNAEFGSGLGLAITSSLVEMMGGSISVESEEGKGSTFKVDLQLGFDVNKHQPEQVLAKYPHLRALVVDDHERSGVALSTILQKYQVPALMVTTGSDALESIEAARDEGQPFDICFFDWRMPEMDGAEIVMGLNEMDGLSHMLKVIVTGHNYLAIAEKVKSLGVEKIVPKPFFKSEILDLLVRADEAYKKRAAEPPVVAAPVEEKQEEVQAEAVQEAPQVQEIKGEESSTVAETPPAAIPVAVPEKKEIPIVEAPSVERTPVEAVGEAEKASQDTLPDAGNAFAPDKDEQTSKLQVEIIQDKAAAEAKNNVGFGTRLAESKDKAEEEKKLVIPVSTAEERKANVNAALQEIMSQDSGKSEEPSHKLSESEKAIMEKILAARRSIVNTSVEKKEE